MQMTTKQIRNIVRNTGVSIYGSWTDKCKCKGKPNNKERLVAFAVSDPDTLAAKLNKELALAGFSNRFYATDSSGADNYNFYARGGSYLRVKAVIA